MGDPGPPLSELETQIFIAKDLGYIKDEGEILEQIDKLFGLMNSLRKRSTK